jgi:protein involved in polysaccharide export with SLBB domain
VIVTGEVQGPGTHVAPGATIEESLALAGGPTPLAQRRRVTLRRRTADGVRALVVDLDAASPIVLCAGDVVSVPRGGD